jgi:hypothetical protein
MNIKTASKMSREDFYDLITKQRINSKTPTENSGRKFPIGGRAYLWTNESLHRLKDQLDLDLTDRDVLLVAASGDPFAAFASLGAKSQVGFDSSHRAILWSELKLEAIKELNYNEFKAFMGLQSDKPYDHKDLWARVSKRLSPYAVSVFTPLIGNTGSVAELTKSGGFFRHGCSGAFPKANLYLEDAEIYERARQGLTANAQLLVPGTLDDLAKIVTQKYGAVYWSNIFDHFTDQEGNLYQEAPIRDFLFATDKFMKKDVKAILQFEWSDAVKGYVTEALTDLGYNDIQHADDGNGYGNMAVAWRKG